MKELVLKFGPEGVLTGIYTPARADARASGRRKPAVILLTAGLVHRAGPYRLYTELARLLGERGFDVLRFDRGGIGESDARPGTLSEDERTKADIQDAMEAMAEKAGAREYILLGLCSGAYNAHLGAASDARVKGAVFLDGYAYRTKGFHRRQKLDRYLDAGRVGRFLLRKTAAMLASKTPAESSASAPPPVDVYEVEAPPFEVFERDIANMIERGTRLLFIYTGGVTYYNHGSQFREMFPTLDFRGCIETEFYSDCGHTYPVLRDRQMLVARLLAWFDRY